MGVQEKVFKYRTWNDQNHQLLLKENALYLSSPKDLNDPFDCRIIPDFRLLTNADVNEYSKRFEAKHKIGSAYIKNRLADRDEIQCNYDKIVSNDADTYYGVLSLCRRWDVPKMWLDYSDNSKGFCIGFWKDKLIEATCCGSKIVKYYPKLPKIKPYIALTPDDTYLEELIFKRLTTKLKHWSYEKEFRLIKHFYNSIPPFQRTIYVPDNIISEVILGVDISENNKTEIIKECKRKEIPVYQALIKDFVIRKEKVSAS